MDEPSGPGRARPPTLRTQVRGQGNRPRHIGKKNERHGT
jgi:hypothetical protein